jgi:hypothetical protein
MDVRQIAFTNDVFRVTTQSHGTYYIKFHTARWYLDLEDTRDVVEHELAGYNLLQKRGFAMPYRMWSDCTQAIVPMSVLICDELGGHSALPLVQRCPDLAGPVARAVGAYLRRLHDIEFTNVSAIAPMHVQIAEPTGRIPYCNPGRYMHWAADVQAKAQELQDKALAELSRAASTGYLPEDAGQALDSLFAGAAEAVLPTYASPRFTLRNCHLNHFHVEQQGQDWRVLGVYDFEGVAADEPLNDLMEIEMGLTTASRSFAWREPLRDAYGEPCSFIAYKTRFLRCLVDFLAGWENREHYRMHVPDRAWLSKQWMRLAAAETWDDFTWYPTLAEQSAL